MNKLMMFALLAFAGLGLTSFELKAVQYYEAGDRFIYVTYPGFVAQDVINYAIPFEDRMTVRDLKNAMLAEPDFFENLDQRFGFEVWRGLRAGDLRIWGPIQHNEAREVLDDGMEIPEEYAHGNVPPFERYLLWEVSPHVL